MIALEPIKWHSEPGDFRGEIGASVKVSADRWRDLGARFTTQDDGNGESPNLAVGSVEVSGDELGFAVLDYGEDTTYLLVPTVDEREWWTSAIISAFVDRGLIAENEILDTTIGIEERDSQSELAARLDSVESTLLALATASAEQRAAAVPRARVVDVLDSGHANDPQVAYPHLAHKRFLSVSKAATGRSRSNLLTGLIQHSNQEGYVQFRPDFGDHLMVILHLDRDWHQIVGEDWLDAETHDEAVHVALEILEEVDLTR